MKLQKIKQKQKRIVQTAMYYISENNITELDMRFDVAEILEKQKQYYFRYIENAFWLE